MNVQLQVSNLSKETAIEITGSKSETNRLLILQALFPNITIKNTSVSDDSEVLSSALETTNGTIDVHHAGTAMRFLTAYFAAKEDIFVTLTGSKRMQQRPIKILVDALRMLGADIQYAKNEGFPPLRIRGKRLNHHTAELQANVSSQYISALLLIAPSLPNGLTIKLQGTITSRPYIKMTLALLEQLNIPFHFKNNSISIKHCEEVKETTITVESDWSSASYFYSLVALSDSLTIALSSFKTESLQGDSTLASLYETLGVTTVFNTETNSIVLQKNDAKLPLVYKADLSNTPDIAQTIAVTCFGLGVGCDLTGLHTLKIKETDRLEALKIELEKLGGSVEITQSDLKLIPSEAIQKNCTITTYNDHRMAMAFAPLALKTPLQIQDADVVSKSFPTFWEEIRKVGIEVITI